MVTFISGLVMLAARLMGGWLPSTVLNKYGETETVSEPVVEARARQWEHTGAPFDGRCIVNEQGRSDRHRG